MIGIKEQTKKKEVDEGLAKYIKSLQKTGIKNYYWLGALLLFGVILLLFGDTETKEIQPPEEKIVIEELEAEYEQRLVRLIEQVDGAGATQVMVTIESGGEKVYAKAQNSDEQINSGPDDIDTKVGYSTDYIIVEDENGNDTALVEKEYEPSVKGVAVLCEGGDESAVVADITELVEVVMGISSNSVFVGKLVAAR